MLIAALLQLKDDNNADVHQLMNKENMVYPYDGILFSHIKEWNIETFRHLLSTQTCCNVDGLQEYYSELKKSEKDCMLSESINIYMKDPEQVIEAESRVLVNSGGEDRLFSEYWMFLMLLHVFKVEMVVAQHCDMLNATELYTLKRLILCHVNFTSEKQQ